MNYREALEKITNMTFEEKKEMQEKMIGQVNVSVLQNVISSLFKSFEYDSLVPLDIQKYLDCWSLEKMPFFLIFGEKLKIKSEKKEQVYNNDIISKRFLEIKNSLSNKKTIMDIDRFLNFIDGLCYETDEVKLSPFLLKWITENKITYPKLLRHSDYSSINLLKDYHYAKEGVKFSKFIYNSFKDKELDNKLSGLIYEIKAMGREDIYDFLSIDPLDYLFVSTNKNNWNSCMYLESQYQQRFSTMSYLLDKPTIVQFSAKNELIDYSLYPDTSYHLECKHLSFFSRRFVYVSEEFVLGARTYPFIGEEKKKAYDVQVSSIFSMPDALQVKEFLKENIQFNMNNFSSLLEEMENKSQGIYFDSSDPILSYSFFFEEIQKMKEMEIISVGVPVPLIRDGDEESVIYDDLRDEDDY